MHCDLAGLVVGPKFRGIKMLPPGLHLFCWDAGQDKVLRFLFDLLVCTQAVWVRANIYTIYRGCGCGCMWV